MNEPLTDTIDALGRRFLQMTDALSAFRALAELQITGAAAPERVAGDALEILLLHGDFHACSVFLRRPDGRLHCLSGRSRSQRAAGASPSHPPHVFDPGEGIAGLVAASGRMRHCRNTAFDARFLPLPDRDIRSLLCLPLKDGEETIGVLNASHPRPNVFDEHQERFLEVFATLFARLFAQWRLTHRLEERLRARTRELETAVRRLEARERRLARATMIEPVTGLFDARFFSAELRRLGARAERSRSPLALLLIQLREQAPPAPLEASQRERLFSLAAGLLRTQIREGDLLGHLGDGLFAVALPGGTHETARSLAGRIHEDLRSLRYRAGPWELHLDADFGLSESLPGKEEAPGESRFDARALIERALEDLGDARRAQGN